MGWRPTRVPNSSLGTSDDVTDVVEWTAVVPRKQRFASLLGNQASQRAYEANHPLDQRESSLACVGTMCVTRPSTISVEIASNALLLDIPSCSAMVR